MIDFGRSYFTCTSHPQQPDPYYKYPSGGFVGRDGAVNRVRMQFDATCTLANEKTGHTDDLFLLWPYRDEYKIVTENLFQVPNGEARLVCGREYCVPISSRPSNEREDLKRLKLSDRFRDYSIQIRTFQEPQTLTTEDEIIKATMAEHIMNARTMYRDRQRGVRVTLEFPVKLINLQQKEKLFQVCMGPVLLPDLVTWDGISVDRVFLAEVAFSGFDYVEFALRREVEASDKEKMWLNTVRGRDRRELRDPNNRPPGYLRPYPRPKVYHEVLAQQATTVLLSDRGE